MTTESLQQIKQGTPQDWRGLAVGSVERTRARFFQNVQLDKNGCWIWTAYRNGKNYGRFAMNRRQRMAHRVSYELLVGPIPDGLVLDHLCRTRPCVNPDHLEPVTQYENDMRAQPFRARLCPHDPLGTTQKCPVCKVHYNRLRVLYLEIGRDVVNAGRASQAHLDEAAALLDTFQALDSAPAEQVSA